MIPYVLILFMSFGVGTSQGAGVAMHEFGSRDACLYALGKVKQGGVLEVWGKCVPKNVKPVGSLPA